MRDRSSSRAVGRVHVGDAGRIGPTPGPVVARIRPKLAGLGAAGVHRPGGQYHAHRAGGPDHREAFSARITTVI